jgi:thiol-disulfide isomerase/thioredoxin
MMPNFAVPTPLCTASSMVPLKRLLLLALAVAAPAALSAQAVPSDAHYRGFQRDGDLTLVVAGKEAPAAEIYHAEAARAYLIITSELPSPILINAPNMTVETVDLMKVSRQPDGSLDLLADAGLASSGKYTVRERDIAFNVGGREVVVKPRPYVLGLHPGAEILAGNPGYQRLAKSYNPDAAILKRLKAHKEDVRVLTFFGSWCPHCKKNLPLLLKVEQGLAGGRIRFDYYGLPTPFGDEPEAKKHGVESVPTAILFVGGQEIGRIPTSQWSNPEVALDLQLNGPGRFKKR